MGAFASSPSPSGVSAAPLPPLPDLQSAAPVQGQGGDPASSPLASLMSGIMPIKSAVDAINMACKQIVQSGVIPGAEEVCGQIVAMAASLLPMAAQAAMQPGMGAPGMGAPGGMGGGIPMTLPPGGPQPLGGI